MNPSHPRSPLVHLATAAALLLWAAACSSSGGGGTGNPPPGPLCATTFTNPVGQGADPWVVRHEGKYYAVESRNGGGETGIWVYRSDTLTTPQKNGIKVWQPASGGWNTS